MSFWKKLFGKKGNHDDSINGESRFDKFRIELRKLGLETQEDLERIVNPLIRKATKIELKPASRPPENSQLISHFGGQPYFEEEEKWPESKSGKPLDFVFQIYNKPNLELPSNIKLIQFYYDWDEFPWDTENDGWLVKIYKNINYKKRIFIATPEDLGRSKYCEIDFTQTKSLPDWEGIDTYENIASKLSSVLNEGEPWENYDQIVTKLIGEQDYQSQLGGYPNWVQGESTPRDKNGNLMKLLFQIDSEDNAGLMWGDVGLIYIFYDKETEKTEFCLQCH